ncbi:MAG: IclR family transcriptional regulator [Clostridiaceae bacterium]|nr:IclR family transcriptional regulator [Clostridiaceae bacterium]
MAKKITRTNQSAEKILDIIEIMACNGGPMRLNDISQKSGMPQSTVFRMINALRVREYVHQDEESAKYQLSMKFAYIGDMINARFDLRDLAHKYMVRVAFNCKNVCYLAVERQMELVYIDMVSPPGSVLTRMPFVGKHAPLHCSGIGRMILSDFTEEKLDEYFETTNLDQYAPKSLTDPVKIREKIAEIQEKGYSVCSEQLENGNGSVAVGIRNYTGRIIAGISVGGPADQLTEEYIQRVLPCIREAADKISSKLFYKAL